MLNYKKWLLSSFLGFIMSVPSITFAEAIGISTCVDLQNIENDLTAEYELLNDIDCSGVNFLSIGQETSFSGSLNGNNYTIKHLNSYPTGLFVSVSGPADIENLSLEEVVVMAQEPGYQGGALSGSVYRTESESVKISNVHVKSGTVNSERSSAGGLVGGGGGVIINSSSAANVKGIYDIGGLVGSGNFIIINSYATGQVESENDSGFVACAVGGLVGSHYDGTIIDSYATGAVRTDPHSAGYAGGLIGVNHHAPIISSYATGEVYNVPDEDYTNWGGRTGGLVGETEGGDIIDSYATGGVVGGFQGTGGLIGDANSEAAIQNTYATGNVVASTKTGGLIGNSEDDWFSVVNSYWNVDTTGQTTSVGGEGKTTIEMYQRDTYVDWDFGDVWDIQEGQSYPLLRILEEEVKIVDCQGLRNMNQNLQGTYLLVSNIDCKGLNFSPIGTVEAPFEGRFDGGTFTISNLTITRADETFIGLWGVASGASIENVDVNYLTIYGREYVGGLVGAAVNNTQLTNAYVLGWIYSAGEHPSKGTIGGLVGFLSESRLERTGAAMEINASQEIANFMGGLVGESESSEISNSMAKKSVFGDSYIGGLVGYSDGDIIVNSYAAVVVGGNEAIGGLLGSANNTTVTSSYWDIELSGQTRSAGGLGKTTGEMWQQKTYVNWDFVNLWTIRENQAYPYLQ